LASFSRLSREALPAGCRIACCIEYNGQRYSGWQIQPHPNVVTVQAELERSLGAVAATDVRVHCAGRTDTGVHACGQIIHFDAPVARSVKAWTLGTNTHLPDDVRVLWAAAVPPGFHARFTAQRRRYRYIICNRRVRPALLRGQVTWQRRPLDASLMHIEAQCLLGERDFSSFQAASCQSPTAMRNVHFISVTRRGELVIIDIQANAFLHHMVRNIMGTLLKIGRSEMPVEWMAELLQGKDRTLAGMTAQPNGLYLVNVEYPEEHGLPESGWLPTIG